MRYLELIGSNFVDTLTPPSDTGGMALKNNFNYEHYGIRRYDGSILYNSGYTEADILQRFVMPD